MQDILQKFNMQGEISGDVVVLHPSGKPVKYTTEIEKMFEEIKQKNPNIVVEFTPENTQRKFILNKDGWFYLKETGRLKQIKKKTVAVMIYKLSKGETQK